VYIVVNIYIGRLLYSSLTRPYQKTRIRQASVMYERSCVLLISIILCLSESPEAINDDAVKAVNDNFLCKM